MKCDTGATGTAAHFLFSAVRKAKYDLKGRDSSLILLFWLPSRTIVYRLRTHFSFRRSFFGENPALETTFLASQSTRCNLVAFSAIALLSALSGGNSKFKFAYEESGSGEFDRRSNRLVVVVHAHPVNTDHRVRRSGNIISWRLNRDTVYLHTS